MSRRLLRLNSLLREVISDVIRSEVHDPHVHPLTAITEVSISKDLRHSKVMASVLGTPEEAAATLEALNRASKFIAITASKEVVIRHFPELRFVLDDSVEKTLHIENILKEIHEGRPPTDQ